MSILKKLIILSSVLIVSCGEAPKKKANKNNDTPQIDGVWERKGTIQFVNENPVDTLIFGKDIEGFKNIKIYSKGNIFWINNSPSQNYKGAGGYGKFKITKNTLTEFMSHGSGSFASFLHYMNDSLRTSSQNYDFKYNLTKSNYTQLGGNVPNSDDESISYGEYYEKLPSLRKSKIDGVWKRAYEISFVNGVAVDTTSVPADALLDVKVFKDGYYLVQVDQTRLINDSSKPEYGGGGGYGQFDYDESGNLVEYGEFNSGAWPFTERGPRDKKNAHYASVSFYDDDLYIQITKDTLGQGQAGRGVVYKRVE